MKTSSASREGTTKALRSERVGPRIAPYAAIMWLLVWTGVGCKTTQIEPAMNDTTPPDLRLGSAGLRKDLLLTQDSTDTETRRAKSTDEVLLVATATDSESGIRRVTLKGELRIVCVPQTGNRLVTIVEPIAQTQAAPSNGTKLPESLSGSYTLSVGTQRARCAQAQSRFIELRLELRAEAENGVGQVRQLPAAIVNSFGPDTLRVATFNLYNPGNHPDSVFVRWGTSLGSLADVLLLTEVRDLRTAKLLADAAGMPYVLQFEDVAIASRAPLRVVKRQVIYPPDRTDNGSNILSAESDLGGYPHQFVVSHFVTKDANRVLFEPWKSSPTRVESSKAILALLKAPPAIVIVGGDFNAYSGIGPQNMPGGTAEIDLLRGQMTDVFEKLGLPNEAHCRGHRIDYIFVRGPYAPAKYEACFDDSDPSDHPFVLTTLVPE